MKNIKFMALFLLLCGCSLSNYSKNNSMLNRNQIFSLLDEEPSISELIKLQSKNKISAELIVQYYIQRIHKHDSEVNALIAVNPFALNDAKKLDQARLEGKNLGLLHGIPILVKDNIETKEMPTTAGSLYLKDNQTGRDAPLVERLRNSGAIILGKTNLSEWANYRSKNAISGWSAVGGLTRNPLNPEYSACGSSSGSAAAVTANLSVAAIGTDTFGSIICPSSVTGIVGLKPTTGSVSRTHIIPLSHTYDSAGPMTKTVQDAAIILEVIAMEVIAGAEDKDSKTNILKRNTAYQDLNKKVELFTVENKLGLLEFVAEDYHPETLNVYKNVLSRLDQTGIKLTNIRMQTKPYPELYDDVFSMLRYEFKPDLNHYFASLPKDNQQKTLASLIAFNKVNAKIEMQYFAQDLFEQAEIVGDLNDPAYRLASSRARPFVKKMLDEMFNNNNVNVIAAIAMDTSWKISLDKGDEEISTNYDYPTIAGYPHITIPMGKVNDLPIGLLLFSRPLEEARLLAFAKHIEQKILQEK